MTRTIAAAALALALAVSQAACGSGSSDLTGKSWQWVSSTQGGTPMPGVVPNPELYTATFNTDGSLAVKADCNNATGTYKASSGSLTITLGPATLAACATGSLSTVFLAALPRAASYTVSGGNLTITLSGGGSLALK